MAIGWERSQAPGVRPPDRRPAARYRRCRDRSLLRVGLDIGLGSLSLTRSRPGSHDVRRRRNRAGRTLCRGVQLPLKEPDRTRSSRTFGYSLVVRHSSVPGSRRACFSTSAARRLHRLPRAHRVRPRSWGCWPRGRDKAGVARRLGVSPKTVHNHASNIITKLHVSDRSRSRSSDTRPAWAEPGSG
jgi:hypothetical protein